MHLLGTGSALSDASRTTTMLAFEGEEGVLLIDCGGDALQRMLAHELDPARLLGVILTHEHPDHIGGLPLLVERLWVAGRRTPLPIWGIEPVLRTAEALLRLFDTSDWPEFAGVSPQVVAHTTEAPMLRIGQWTLHANPTRHSLPGIALRLRVGDAMVAYSGDTEPTASFVTFARGADLLIHEATGAVVHHSSIEQAASVASASGAKRLVLVHLPNDLEGRSEELAAARKIFPALEIGFDGDRLEVTASL